MKEEGQKILEVELQRALQEVIITIQKCRRGILARRLYRQMQAAMKVITKKLLYLVVRWRWHQLMYKHMAKIRDAKKKIRKFYRFRYMCKRACFEVDERIRIRKEKEIARLTEIARKKAEEERNKLNAQFVSKLRDLFVKKNKENKARYEAERKKKLEQAEEEAKIRAHELELQRQAMEIRAEAERVKREAEAERKR